MPYHRPRAMIDQLSRWGGEDGGDPTFTSLGDVDVAAPLSLGAYFTVNASSKIVETFTHDLFAGGFLRGQLAWGGTAVALSSYDVIGSIDSSLFVGPSVFQYDDGGGPYDIYHTDFPPEAIYRANSTTNDCFVEAGYGGSPAIRLAADPNDWIEYSASVLDMGNYLSLPNYTLLKWTDSVSTFATFGWDVSVGALRLSRDTYLGNGSGSPTLTFDSNSGGVSITSSGTYSRLDVDAPLGIPGINREENGIKEYLIIGQTPSSHIIGTFESVVMSRYDTSSNSPFITSKAVYENNYAGGGTNSKLHFACDNYAIITDVNTQNFTQANTGVGGGRFFMLHRGGGLLTGGTGVSASVRMKPTYLGNISKATAFLAIRNQGANAAYTGTSGELYESSCFRGQNAQFGNNVREHVTFWSEAADTGTTCVYHGLKIEGNPATAAAGSTAAWIGSGGTYTNTVNGIAFGSGKDVILYRSGAGELSVDNDFVIGGDVGFYGGPTATQPTGWNPTNEAADRAWDCNATTINELADVLATVVNDLIANGLFSA